MQNLIHPTHLRQGETVPLAFCLRRLSKRLGRCLIAINGLGLLLLGCVLMLNLHVIGAFRQLGSS